MKQKIKIILVCCVSAPIFCCLCNAQVGINTENPQTSLDIVQKDQSVKGKGFRLDDGNQGDGKVLTCNDNGVGTWIIPATHAIIGTKATTDLVMDYQVNQTYQYTGASITLPPGKWYIEVTQLLSLIQKNSSIYNITAEDVGWIHLSFLPAQGLSSTNGINAYPDYKASDNAVMSNEIRGPYMTVGVSPKVKYSTIRGVISLKNPTSSDMIFYLVVRLTTVSRSQAIQDGTTYTLANEVQLKANAVNGENLIRATRLPD